VRREQRTPFGFFATVTSCGKCDGEGTIVEQPCRECKGSGKMVADRTIHIKIPEGVASGSHLRLKGEGEAGSKGGSPGDLYVVIHVKPHAFFERVDDDLVCQIPISFSQAALGAEVEVPTISGKAKLKVPAGTQTNTVFRLKGEGMPRLHGRTRGDQHVRVLVETPKKLSSDAKKIFEQLQELEKTQEKSFFERLKDSIGGD
jgi:molecular chaperone DnaJ